MGDTLDPTDPKARRVAERLTSERVIWMVTVAPDGTPQPSPVWFLWDGDTFLVYSLPSARVRNLSANPRVALHLDSDGRGGDIVIVEGDAAIDPEAGPADRNAAYLDKYGPVLDEYGWSATWFAERYRVPIRVTPTRWRYW